MAMISACSSALSGVGEWTNSAPSGIRITVMRVGKGIFGHGAPKRMTGPSTIQRSFVTGFSVLRGG
jgi:hypothetical protein